MEIYQVYEVVNSIAEEALGIKNLTPTDTSFVDVGKTVLNNEDNTDSWYKTLWDRIGRTELSLRPYNGDTDFLRRNPIEWGAVLQKLYIDTPQASVNDSWNPQSQEAADPFEIFQTNIQQDFYSKMSVWEFDLTVPDVQLRTAFNSPEQQAAFINGLFMAQQNDLEGSYENLANSARANFINAKIKAGGMNAINVLAVYNTETNKSLTVANMFEDLDFQKWLVMTFNLYADRMTRRSVLFNTKNRKHHTPKKLQVLTILSDVEKRISAFLQADTYHKELLTINGYSTVPYWQSPGTDYSFEHVSTVSTTDGTTETTTPYVLAVLHDIEAIGTTVQGRRTRSIYNPRKEYNNYFAKAEMGYFNDLGENGIVFYAAET